MMIHFTFCLLLLSLPCIKIKLSFCDYIAKHLCTCSLNVDNTKKKTGIGKDLLNARSFLQLPLNRNFIGKGEDTPHLDRRTPHIVFLYYVCDSDGDTIIYDYKSKHAEDVPYKEDVNVLKRVSPKQGRVVVFDGLHWHTAEQPTKDKRCIINFNISTNGT